MGEKTHWSPKRMSGSVAAVFFPPGSPNHAFQADLEIRETSSRRVAQDLQGQSFHLLGTLAAGSDLLDRAAFAHALREGDAIAEAGLRCRSGGQHRPHHLVGD